VETLNGKQRHRRPNVFSMAKPHEIFFGIAIGEAFPLNKLFLPHIYNYVFNTCHRGPPVAQWEMKLGSSFVNKYTFIFLTRCDYKLNQENPTT